MTNIFYNLQLSFIDRNGVFLLNKDSNFSVFYNIAKSMAKYYPKYKFFVPIPLNNTGEEILKGMQNVVHFKSDCFTKRVFSSRYHWNSDTMAELVHRAKPELIWENNPTLVNNWKTLLIEEKLIDTVKILTYNHWIDSPWFSKIDARAPYYVRQCEGAYYADKILCNSEDAVDQILECVNSILPWAVDRIEANIDTLAPYIDDETITTMEGTKETGVVNIIYNHRLSSLPYYDKPYKLFLDSIICLNEKTSNFNPPFKMNIHFTDASGKLSSRNDIPIADTENMKIKLHENLDKITYWKLLKKMDVCVGSFFDNYGGAWSISLAEGILAGCNTIVPNHSGYKEMVPENYSFLLKTQAAPEDLASMILMASVLPLETSARDFYLKNYSMKVLSTKLDNILTSMFTKQEY